MRAPAASLVKDSGLIIAIAAVLSIAANVISPRGIIVTRDYFPAGRATHEESAGQRSAAAAESSSPASPTLPQASSARPVTKRGLPLAKFDEVAELFRDPRYAQGLVLFIDARDEGRFAAGHVAGAHLFDHYHIERYSADVLAIAPLAERIVVYCTGGECEDSELAALDLFSLGIPADKVVIYGGGITEWTQRQMPVEKGALSSPR